MKRNLCREGRFRRKWVVLLQPKRPEISQRRAAESGRRLRLLEGHRHRQGHLQRLQIRGSKKSSCFLQREAPQRHQNWLDHAWVSSHWIQQTNNQTKRIHESKFPFFFFNFRLVELLKWISWLMGFCFCFSWMIGFCVGSTRSGIRTRGWRKKQRNYHQEITKTVSQKAMESKWWNFQGHFRSPICWIWII